MARFERRITDAEVNRARAEIAAGASLRSVAAKIPCAPSTLSVRLKQATAEEPDLSRVSHGRENGAATDDRHGVEPLAILRSALLATKSNGLPHWPTRLAAVRMLATLRPEEFEHRGEEERSEPEIVVFDLEPGSTPVLHRAPRKQEPARDSSQHVQLPSEDLSPKVHMFSYGTAIGEGSSIGTWSSPRSEGTTTVALVFHTTDDAEEAARWRAELSAGRLPVGIE
jgi:hypothetical protein